LGCVVFTSWNENGTGALRERNIFLLGRELHTNLSLRSLGGRLIVISTHYGRIFVQNVVV
jgi:hypothetical protein